MQEFIGLAYFAEIPSVVFDVQRGSPSTGMVVEDLGKVLGRAFHR